MPFSMRRVRRRGSALPFFGHGLDLAGHLLQVFVGQALAGPNEGHQVHGGGLQLLVGPGDPAGGLEADLLGLQLHAGGQHPVGGQVVDLLIEGGVGVHTLLPKGVGEDLGDGGVAVDHEDLVGGGGGHMVDPVQQVVPVGVGGQAPEIVDGSVDGDVLAEETDLLGPLQQMAAQGPFPLVAHEDHGALRPPQVVLEVVADPAGVAHAGGGDDDLGGLVHVQQLGLVAALGHGQPGEGEQTLAALDELDGLLVQVAPQVTGEDLGGLVGQGGVHHHGEVGVALDQSLLLHFPHEVQQLLGAAHGKGGDDDVAAPGEGVVDDLGQGLGVGVHGLVVPVAVGALHDHIVGPVHIGGIPDDGLVDVAQVSGEEELFLHPVLAEPHLHTGGAQQVAGVHEADLAALEELDGLAVFGGDQVVGHLKGVFHGVQRLHRGPACAHPLLVLVLGLHLLDVGRVLEHDVQQLAGEAGGEDLPLEALLDEQGHPAGVVDVGMGDDDVINIVGGKVQNRVVPLVLSLLEAAVDEDLLSAHFHAVAAAGDSLGCAEKGQFHEQRAPFSIEGPGRSSSRPY